MHNDVASLDPAFSYRNPVIDADWPDPDAIRIGDEYFLVASSFTRTPGLPLLASSNLVDWTIIGHAVSELPPAGHFDLPRPGAGAWAPSLRHHDGVFYVVFPDPDHGVYVTTATDPRGPWSDPHLLFAARGAIDPCPLWDADGRTWLVHGWAESRSGIGNRIDLIEVTSDLRSVLSPRQTVIDGDLIEGCHTLEGPKIYRDRGWYWIFAPAGGVATGWQSVFRSSSLDGPWEHRIVMSQGDTPVNGPHQGAWVTTAGGEDWFLHFQDRGPFGRVLHLQPMSWTPDGWPIIGRPGADGLVGYPVKGGRTPDNLPRKHAVPSTSDDFSAERLSLQWSFPATPPRHTVELRGDGEAHLSFIANDHGDVRALAQAMTQPVPGQPCRIRTRMRLDGSGAGRAGIALLGAHAAWLGLVRESDGQMNVVCRRTASHGSEVDLIVPASVGESDVELEVEVDDAALARFRWCVDGVQSAPSSAFHLSAGRWVGAEIALFAAAPFGSREPDSHAVFSRFDVSVVEVDPPATPSLAVSESARP